MNARGCVCACMYRFFLLSTPACNHSIRPGHEDEDLLKVIPASTESSVSQCLWCTVCRYGEQCQYSVQYVTSHRD